MIGELSSAGIGVPPTPAPAVRRRAMVVDDEPRIRSYVQAALGQFDPVYDVVTAADAAEAVEWSESKGVPNLVLLGHQGDHRWAFHYARYVSQSGGLVVLLSPLEDIVSTEWKVLPRPPALSDLLDVARAAMTGSGFLAPVESAIS